MGSKPHNDFVLAKVHEIRVCDAFAELACEVPGLVGRGLKHHSRTRVILGGVLEFSRKLADVLVGNRHREAKRTCLGEHVSRGDREVKEVLELIEDEGRRVGWIRSTTLYGAPNRVQEKTADQSGCVLTLGGTPQIDEQDFVCPDDLAQIYRAA
jgi:hypothetical protein